MLVVLQSCGAYALILVCDVYAMRPHSAWPPLGLCHADGVLKGVLSVGHGCQEARKADGDAVARGQVFWRHRRCFHIKFPNWCMPSVPMLA